MSYLNNKHLVHSRNGIVNTRQLKKNADLLAKEAKFIQDGWIRLPETQALCTATARLRLGNNSRQIPQTVPSHPLAVQCSLP